MDDSHYKTRFERADAARQEAERLLEEKSLELYTKNQSLVDHQSKLEETIQLRTSELIDALQTTRAAEHSKTKIIEFLSHELFTPLNAIAGASSIIRSTQLTPFQDRQIKLIENAYQTLLNLCNDMLGVNSEHLKSYQSMTYEEEVIPFYLHLLFQRLKSDIQQIKRPQQSLYFRINRHLPNHLAGDYASISDVGRQAINLIFSQFLCAEIDFILDVDNRNISLKFDILNKETQPPQTTQNMFESTFEKLENYCQTFASSITIRIDKTSAQSASLEFRFPIEILKATSDQDAAIFIDAPIYVDIANSKLKSHVMNILFDSNIFCEDLTANPLIKSSPKTGLYCIVISDVSPIEETSLVDWVVIAEQLPHQDSAHYHLPPPFADSELIAAIEFYLKRHLASQIKQKDIKSSNILVVDDIEVNREVAKQILTLAGHRVTTANDGLECLELLAHHHFDAIVMDIQMPNMNGLEATRSIRALKNEKQTIPIIALTAQWTQSIAKEAREAGMDRYLLKPINSQHLIDTISSLIQPTEPNTASRSVDKPTTKTEPAQQTEPIYAPQQEPQAKNEATTNCWINFTDSLPRVNNNREILLTILKKFSAKNSGFGQKISRLIGDENFEDARRELHAIKGSSATIGATKLSAATASVEQQLKSTNKLTLDELGLFLHALEATLDEINQL